MLHLSNMRKSKHYKQILLDNEVRKYAEKYQFRSTRAEQDFFVLLDAEHHDELFYVVPCQWNRQLCKMISPALEYRNCPKPIHAYHGNNLVPRVSLLCLPWSLEERPWLRLVT